MEVFDFILDDNGDLLMQGGDLLVAESTLQHQRDLLLASKGDFRQFPLIGVGVERELLNDIGPTDLRVMIQREFERDGMLISRLFITGELQVDVQASYRDA